MKRYTVLLIGVLLALLALAGGRPATPAQAAADGMVEKILFVSDRGGSQVDICVMNADGSNQTRLTTDAGPDVSPTWSPDGTKIAFVAGRPIGEIYVMNADGSEQTKLTNIGGGVSTPAWSPDGTRIAFAYYDDGLYVVNADGSGVAQLTNLNDENPAWSPDGTKLAFNRQGEIMVRDMSSGNVINVTNDAAYDTDPDWSPDGTQLAYTTQVSGSNEDIAIINADGAGRTLITPFVLPALSPSWSPDGTQIAYTMYSQTGADVAVSNVDGSNSVLLTTIIGWDAGPDWQAVPGQDGPRTFLPTGDTYVVQSRPTRNFGRLMTLKTRQTTTDINSFVKFRVSSLPNVEEATLRLYVTNPGKVTALYATLPYFQNTSMPWDELTLNWNNAPTFRGAPLAQFMPARRNRWLEIDVTDGVQAAIAAGRDEVSFALSTGASDLVVFNSKDQGHRAPELVIITE